MRNCLRMSSISRSLAVLLTCLTAAPLPAQTPQATTTPTQINILILEGEGAINNVRQRVARESMVQVEDENHKPVAGAAVTFFLPGDGASGVFSNGSHNITVLTDAEGKAAARGIHMNKVAGKLQIRVVASYIGLSANTMITQTNALGAASAAAGGASAGGGISGKLLAIILLAGAGAAAGGVVLATGGGNSTPAQPPTPTPAVVVTPGTPTVGPPR